MEYARRRKRNQNMRARQRSGGSGAGKVIMALLIAGAVIYLISASAAGTWIAENMVAPVFKAFDSIMPGPQTTSGTSLVLSSDGTNEAGVTQEIEIPAMTCYALQMGVYNEKNNAQNQANQLKQRGAAGYILEDGVQYRVLAAAYESQESLKSVREQLKTENLDSTSYVFSFTPTSLRVTATKEQLKSISDGIVALSDLQKNLGVTALSFDKEQKTVEEGKRAVSEMKRDLQQAYDVLCAQAKDESPILRAIKECFTSCLEEMNALSSDTSEDFVDFSSKMKHAHLHVIDCYGKMGRTIFAAS